MRFKSLQHCLEYAVTLGFYSVMRGLPLPVASRVGSALMRTLGPLISRSDMAHAQMRAHLPRASDADIAHYLRGMWDNLGRMCGEYAHLHRRAMDARITIQGGEILHDLKARNQPFLIISGHIGNWEIVPKAPYILGLPVHVVYRPPNNPYIHRMIDTIRMRYSLGHYGKGVQGARGVMDAFKKGESVLILIDQKDNQGTALDFMGSPAMTMTSAAKIALKYNVAVVPCFIERTQGAHFNAVFQPVLTPPPPEAGNAETRAELFTQSMNHVLSAWITAHPAQWFWLHRRWPKEAS